MDQSTGAAETIKRVALAPGVIVLARHGRPKGDRKLRVDWRGYIDWWGQYDRDGLSEGQVPPPALVDLAAKSHVIFASSLQRAIETAQAAAPGRTLVVDPIFVEAPLPPPPIPGKRRAKDWGVWARVFWWFGRSAGQETRQEAERRAEAAVATLTARALRGENVLLCAHGWFNRMMRPVLRAQGWRCVEDNGDKYWSYRRYEKRS
jgi:broad specificity phosphatase PhoE